MVREFMGEVQDAFPDVNEWLDSDKKKKKWAENRKESKDKWKNTRIKPLIRMNENIQYVVFWKNNQTNDIETSIYKPN